MESTHPIKLFLILTLVTLACGLPTASPAPTVALSPQGASVPTTESRSNLTIEQIKNTQYQLLIPETDRVIQLINGSHQSGTDTLAADYAYVNVTQFFALGDVTGDGLGDAAVLFVENYGGTGQFGVLAIYVNVSGEPLFVTSTLVDDRPQINSIALDNGEFL